ncbi:hypothetical protein SASPL_106969 [Salvia splendens]|uniref:Mediator of RNA polymerase II transcription subunit 6 n=1 Tax=Salvia splendens TaxID=180675 RepID=A0A8X8YF82_SALSN|nr:hypothetical protein SASPL_106969 [Salvia splendens]
MAATPMIPPPGDGAAVPPTMVAPPPPGTDMTSICFRDQLWLNTYPLDRNLVFDYFALSPFYDYSCNNEQLRIRAIHPLDISHLSKMTGIEFMLSEVLEPHLFVFKKQKRDGPEKVTPMLTYYVLDGSVYQAPQLCNVFASRVSRILGRALYHISKAFNTAASKLEKIGYVDAENESASSEPKAPKETINFKELKRVDHILASLQRKIGSRLFSSFGISPFDDKKLVPVALRLSLKLLPPAPPPPPFPEGYAPPTADGEKSSDAQQEQLATVDPIIDQGPSKRMKI